MKLLPTIRLHQPSCVATFEFFIHNRQISIPESLDVFKLANDQKTKSLWAFRPTGDGYIIYSPPQEFSILANEFQADFRYQNLQRLFEWLPPYVASEFIGASSNIMVTIENSDQLISSSLFSLITDPNRV